MLTNEFINHLESKEEVTAYFEEVLRFKPLLLTFTRIHKVPFLAMCWQNKRVVVWKKSNTNRELLNIINKTIVNVQTDIDFNLLDMKQEDVINPALWVGKNALSEYLVKSNWIEKHGVK
jgi:protein-arginine kinase